MSDPWGMRTPEEFTKLVADENARLEAELKEAVEIIAKNRSALWATRNALKDIEGGIVGEIEAINAFLVKHKGALE